MRRFLVVGCGGSGGKTIAYLMDQLRSDLSKDGVDRLPTGWQFVFVDVPSAVENGPDGLGSVVQQGGTYIGMGPRGGSYRDLDQTVSQKLREGGGLGEVGTWAPARPDQVMTPIDVGAGQYRAIGRMILLAQAGEVREALRQAWGRLVTPDATTSMSNASHALGTEFKANEPPIVFVIGSMAGGSGASMVLDVCRLLTQVPGLNPKLISVFMASADVFDTLPPASRSGVRANALAMLGEIVSSQSGAAQQHDVAVLSGLGVNDGVGTPIPFARVFPVGRLMGAQQAEFGDGSMNAVYRGLARGLAGLMTSEVASSQFINYDLGNTGSKPADPRYLGWGAEPDPLPWGSYGFASLSMGRDRYAEYAAQRIARSCVDRLLDGHLQEGSSASGTEQVNALLDSQWPAICDRLQLPAGRLAAQQAAEELGRWMTGRALPRESAEASARQIVEREFSPYVPSPQQQRADQWRSYLHAQTVSRRQAIAQAVDRAGYEWAFGWQQGLMTRLVDLVGDAVATLGLPYAGALVDRLASHLSDFVVPNAQQISRGAEVDITELPPEISGLLATLRGPITNGQAMVDKVVKSVQDKVRTQLYTRSSGLIAEGLRTFVPDVLLPLRAAVSEQQILLEQARSSQLRHDGLARLETTQYVAWPSDRDERVPTRFDEANNEVLLTSSAQFPGRYAAHLQASVPAEVAGPSAGRAVISQVIAGLWATQGGVQPPRGLMETRVGWQSRAFPTDPTTGASLVPSEARFDVHVRPAELLARARMFVARPKESFDVFCSESIRDYLRADNRESEQQQRRRDLVAKFRETLDLAVPLISVDEQTVKMLHRVQSVEYRYKFSSVPFRNLAITADLEAALTSDPMIDASSLDNFQKALTDQGNPRRIDVFGSYPLYSPLAFDSVLEPVIREWDGVAAQGRGSYWKFRRTRPLAAALAMSDAERAAMVAGWYIGQIVGEIRLPEPPYATPVHIWDPADSRWVAFPHPLLTPPSQFRTRYDWLPAVLESHLLAIARAQQPPVMASLKPYLLLRELYDNNDLGPAGGILDVSAIQKLATWLQSGSASGSPSRVPAIAAAETPEDRRDAAKKWLVGANGPGEIAVQHFLPPSDPGAAGGTFSKITSRDQAAQTPYFRDLAADVAAKTAELAGLLDRAYEVAQRQTPAAAEDAPFTVAAPEGWDF